MYSPVGDMGLFNCNRYQSVLARMQRGIADARLNSTHQSFLIVLDLPPNKTGLLQISIHTAMGSSRRFGQSGAMTACSQPSKNPETNILQPIIYNISPSHDAPVEWLSRHILTILQNHSLASLVGAMAHDTGVTVLVESSSESRASLFSLLRIPLCSFPPMILVAPRTRLDSLVSLAVAATLATDDSAYTMAEKETTPLSEMLSQSLSCMCQSVYAASGLRIDR